MYLSTAVVNKNVLFHSNNCTEYDDVNVYLPRFWEGHRPWVGGMHCAIPVSHVVVKIKVEVTTQAVQLVGVGWISPHDEVTVAIAHL